MITGDHPQAYSNDLHLFGRRRGSGETVWDIKKNVGVVSARLHRDYRVGGSVLGHFPDRLELLADVEPVYAELAGWNRPVSAARRASELPREAAALVELVESEVGVPVGVVGVGPERDDYVLWSSA